MKLIEIIILLLLVIVIINSTDSAQTIDDIMQKPELFLIGAMKCGTTTLFDLLTQHPQICNDAHKEKHYYDKTEQYEKGYKFYMSMFEGCDPKQFYLDVSLSLSLSLSSSSSSLSSSSLSSSSLSSSLSSSPLLLGNS